MLHSVPIQTFQQHCFTQFTLCTPGDLNLRYFVRTNQAVWRLPDSMQNTNAKRIYRYYIDLTKFIAPKHAPKGSKYSSCQHITTVSVSRQTAGNNCPSNARRSRTVHPHSTAKCQHSRSDWLKPMTLLECFFVFPSHDDCSHVASDPIQPWLHLTVSQ